MQATITSRATTSRSLPPRVEVSEGWVQLNPDGTPCGPKIDIPSTEDGPKVSVIYAKDRSEVWFRTKRSTLLSATKT